MEREREKKRNDDDDDRIEIMTSTLFINSPMIIFLALLPTRRLLYNLLNRHNGHSPVPRHLSIAVNISRNLSTITIRMTRATEIVIKCQQSN